MNPIAATVLALAASAPAQEIAIAPALEDYTQNLLLGEVWQRPGLAPRDRSIVTIATLWIKEVFAKRKE